MKFQNHVENEILLPNNITDGPIDNIDYRVDTRRLFVKLISQHVAAHRLAKKYYLLGKSL